MDTVISFSDHARQEGLILEIDKSEGDENTECFYTLVMYADDGDIESRISIKFDAESFHLLQLAMRDHA